MTKSNRKVRERGLRRAQQRRRRRVWPWMLFGLPLTGIFIGALLLTDSRPVAEEQPAPDARQVAAAQSVLRQLSNSPPEAGTLTPVALNAVQVKGLGAVAANAFKPNRIELVIDDIGFRALGSYRLPIGRWLNVGLSFGRASEGFQTMQIFIGNLELNPHLSRLALEMAGMALRWKYVDPPDLDALVRSVRVDNGRMSAEVDVGAYRELVSKLVAGAAEGPGASHIGSVYCRLAATQRQRPVSEFSALVRRAFAADPSDPDVVQANRDTIVALAMLVVDKRVGYLAGVVPTETQFCVGDAHDVTLHGRQDSPKHWLMSAAFAVTTGSQLSQAAGEWKELADSVSGQSEFAHGDSTGFSLVDIGADRSGELIAQAAIAPDRAAAVRHQLAEADDDALMPRELLKLSDGLGSAEFVRHYGSIDDVRYRTVRDWIDATIRASTPAGR